MVKTQTDLQAEINELIHSGIEAGQIMPANWIIQEIVERHSSISGNDQDFYLLCAYSHVRDSVRTCLRCFKGDSGSTPEQLRLPGYEHLQKAYLIDRDNEQQIVPLTDCTDLELAQKVKDYRSMADGCIKHANELDRYRHDRFGVDNAEN